MSYREVLKEHLIDEEGLRYSMYKCPAGKNTIGVGHNCDANPLPRSMQEYLDTNGKLTLQMILELLEKDIDKSEQGARQLFDGFNDFTENQKVSIVDLVFILGRTGLSKFITFGQAVRSGNWYAAAQSIRNSKMYRQIGNRGEKIAKLLEG